MSNIVPILRKRASIWVAVLITVVALVLRLPGLGSFMTVDEENWMIRSSHFWHNIFRNKDTGGAFMTTHPGATAMWIIGAGEVIQEQRLGFDVDEGNLRHFRTAATLPVATATSLLIGIAASLSIRLVGNWGGAGIGLFLAVDPYLTGMSQIAHLDALLALFMLNAVLAFFLSLKNLYPIPPAGGTPQTAVATYNLLTGIFTGLAMATKLLPSLWLFVFFGLVLIVRHRRDLGRQLPPLISTGFFIGGVAILTFYLVWPALWFTDDVGRSFRKDVPTIIADEHVAIAASEEPIEPATFYIRTILGRSTPIVLIISAGLLLASIRELKQRRHMGWPLWIALYATGFILLITWVAKKGDRYALPAHVGLVVMAGYGLVLALIILRSRFKFSQLWFKGSAGVIFLALIAQTLLWSPHAIAYNNPYLDVRPLTQQGWGEGLEAAAAWLNKHPFRERLYVASWYPSVLQTYFAGPVLSLSSRDDHRVGFVVTYRNMESRAEDDIASNVLDEFRHQEPAHVIEIGGQPYVWIYSTLGSYYFRQHTGEMLPGMEVGQLVPVSFNEWERIDLALATFGRENMGTITLHIRESLEAEEDLRTIPIDVANIPDQDWQRFEFAPIKDSGGKTYYVVLTAEDAAPGNAVTVRYSSEDVLPGHAVLRQAARDGDLGYRLP